MNQLIWREKEDEGEALHIDRTSNELHLKTQPKTDFWRTPTSMKMSGHFGYVTVAGDFQVSVKVKGEYKDQYDQAGLMLYLSPEHWLKAGVELINDIPHISVVVTHPYSDWSVIPVNNQTPTQFENEGLNIRVERKGQKIIIDYYLDSESSEEEEAPWAMMRKITCFFPDPRNQKLSEDGEFTPQPSIEVGIMAASPQSSTGFSANFSHFLLNQ